MVNEWNKTALVAEFETMLRRRLKNGAAPVAACAGFDPDAASAYLEGALGGSHRAGYESHLAGCAACRRHLIGLARLVQSAPLAEAQPVAAPERIPTWERWKEAVAVWFDHSSRNFKWWMAGATGAAFAILIAGLGAQFWRQTFKHSDVAVSQNTAAPSRLETASQASQSPAPEPSTPEPATPELLSKQLADSPAEGTVAINQEARSRVPAPAPLVGPQGGAPTVAVEAKSSRLAAPASQPVEAPGVMTRSAVAIPETGQNPTSRLTALSTTERADATIAALNGRSQDLKEEAAIDIKDPAHILRPSPPPRLNRMKPGQPDPNVRNRGALSLLSERQATPNPEPSAKPADSKSTSLIKDVVSAIAKRNPLKWSFNSEAEQKESEDDESANILVWRFQGKVFLFVKGTWIDQDYKPEMQEWRRFSLTRGSDEYKRVLASEPQLKEFFDKGPILIVWKNQIYKVLK
jgi:hypothetical protein